MTTATQQDRGSARRRSSFHLPAGVTEAALARAGDAHTLVVRAAMDNVFAIIGELDLFSVFAGRKPPVAPEEVLEAMARVRAVDPRARRKAAEIARTLAEMGTPARQLPDGRREELRVVSARIFGSRSISVLNRQLDGLAAEATSRGDAELLTGVRLGQAFLSAGASSIYDAGYPYHRFRGSPGSGVVYKGVVDVATSDVATGGSIGVRGGWQAGLAAGIGASTVQAVKDVVDEVQGDDDVPLFEDIIDKYDIPV
jgi:hypothetical protein